MKKKMILKKILLIKKIFVPKTFTVNKFSIRKLLFITFLMLLVSNTCSCALLQKSIDKRTGFSNCLLEIENNIRNDNWDDARESLTKSERTWKKIKPLLQIDIDHDYVNDMEENFVKLYAYIDTREKASSLATILFIKDVWVNIGTF